MLLVGNMRYLFVQYFYDQTFFHFPIKTKVSINKKTATERNLTVAVFFIRSQALSSYQPEQVQRMSYLY